MMNDTIKTILERRSVRNFKHDQINEEELNLILKAALFAPSAMNQQAWHFTVIQNDEIIETINQIAKDFFEKSDNEHLRARAKVEKLDMFYNAPTVIIVSAEDSALLPDVDSAAATQNILLAATALNVGSCWNGAAQFVFPTEAGKELKRQLKIPEGYTPKNMVALGYSAGEAQQALPRKKNKVNYVR